MYPLILRIPATETPAFEPPGNLVGNRKYMPTWAKDRQSLPMRQPGVGRYLNDYEAGRVIAVQVWIRKEWDTLDKEIARAFRPRLQVSVSSFALRV